MQNLPSIYQLGSDFVKQLFRIQIQKGGKVLLRNQVKSRMEACYSELILDSDFAHFFEDGAKLIISSEIKIHLIILTLLIE